MEIVVLKFGGTSIRDKEGFTKSIVHIKKELKLNHKIVCVVSAMGRNGEPYATDTLKNLIKNRVTKKEQDRLLSLGEMISSIVFTDYLIDHGIKAISLSTKEIGIITNNNFGNADIIKVNDLDIINKLSEYDVVVVPGFQGLTVDYDVATFGRGGSDSTAIALGIHLKAKYIDIISDVAGVFTADPRIVPKAIKLPKINYDVLLDMTKNGSKVLNYKGAKLIHKDRVKLKFVDIEDFNRYTEVVDEPVFVTNLSYKNDFIRYSLEKGIGIFDYVFKYSHHYYVHSDYEYLFEDYLKSNEIQFSKDDGFSKITVLKYDEFKSEDIHFVKSMNVFEKLNEFHQKTVEMG